MTTTVLDDPALETLRRRLEAIYGDRLARVVLFGSRARGDRSLKPESVRLIK